MRTFYFKARNIGQEKYLTYTLDDNCELDEDVLDYCEDNDVAELLDIIYEEDDDFDYLTYDITGKTSLADYIKNEVSSEDVLLIIRNVANNMISLKEQAIHLSYVLLNREYVYIDKDYNIKFICVPIESKASLAIEFKSFIRQLLANMKYEVNGELSYVAKLLTYINGSNFNLRGLIELTEALMDDAGIEHDEVGGTVSDGVEVVDNSNQSSGKSMMSEFMNNAAAADEPLPEIGDDGYDDYDDEPYEDDYDDDDDLEPLSEQIPTLDLSDYESNDVADNKDTAEAANTNEAKNEEDKNSDANDNVEKADDEKEEITEAKDTDEAEASKEVADDDVKSDDEETEDSAEIEESTEADDAEDKASDEKPEAADAPKEESVEKVIEKIKPAKKETDINVIRDRMKQLVGEVPAARTKEMPKKPINTLADLDDEINNKKPMIKKSVVKVNRAALIASLAEQEAETEKLTVDENGTPIETNTENDVDAVEESKEVKEAKENAVSSTLLNAPKATPYLVRVNTEERVMLNKTVFKIGKGARGVDYHVGGNGAISRQHAIILQRDGVCYIKDNKSTNHTYVNEKMIDEGVEEILTHDSVIKLGDEEFIFKIR